LEPKGHPQIAQVSTDEFHLRSFSICANLRNLWINPFVTNTPTPDFYFGYEEFFAQRADWNGLYYG